MDGIDNEEPVWMSDRPMQSLIEKGDRRKVWSESTTDAKSESWWESRLCTLQMNFEVIVDLITWHVRTNRGFEIWIQLHLIHLHLLGQT